MILHRAKLKNKRVYVGRIDKDNVFISFKKLIDKESIAVYASFANNEMVSVVKRFGVGIKTTEFTLSNESYIALKWILLYKV